MAGTVPIPTAAIMPMDIVCQYGTFTNSCSHTSEDTVVCQVRYTNTKSCNYAYGDSMPALYLYQQCSHTCEDSMPGTVPIPIAAIMEIVYNYDFEINI
jgi:hypothetical protein